VPPLYFSFSPLISSEAETYQLIDKMMQENVPIRFPEHTEDDSLSSSADSDEHSSLNDSQSFAENNGPSEAQKHHKEIQQMVEQETRSVNAWRALVAAAMIIIGIFASVSTYFFLSNEEELAFVNGVSDIQLFPRVHIKTQGNL
jgi:hypothetical protein